MESQRRRYRFPEICRIVFVACRICLGKADLVSTLLPVTRFPLEVDKLSVLYLLEAGEIVDWHLLTHGGSFQCCASQVLLASISFQVRCS